MKAITTTSLLLTLLVSSGSAQSIRALYPPGAEGGVSIRGVSRNGEHVTIVGDSGSSAFLWNGGAIQPVAAQITGLSSNGAVIAGYTPAQETTVDNGPVTFGSNTAFIQTIGSAQVQIPPPAGYDYVVSHDLSANGTFLLVTAYKNQPVVADQFRWSEATGYMALGRFSDPFFTDSICPDVDAISQDGSIIIGLAASQLPPLRWTASTGWTLFPDDDWTYNQGSVSVSSDGSVVMGNQLINDTIDREVPWRWVSGTKTPLPTLSNSDSFYLYGTNAAGTLAIGQSRTNGSRAPAVWQQGVGTREFSEIIPQTIDTSGWTFQRVLGVSGDGTVFSGEGVYQGQDAVFVISFNTALPPAPTPPPSPTPNPTPVPKPSIALAKVPATTHRKSLVIRGTAPNATAVEFTINKAKAKRSPVKGQSFSFKARLLAGKNVIKLRAVSTKSASAWKTLRVSRK